MKKYIAIFRNMNKFKFRLLEGQNPETAIILMEGDMNYIDSTMFSESIQVAFHKAYEDAKQHPFMWNYRSI
jgi:hypothetical protein